MHAFAQIGQGCVNSSAPSGNGLRRVFSEYVIRYKFKTTKIIKRKKKQLQKKDRGVGKSGRFLPGQWSLEKEVQALGMDT